MGSLIISIAHTRVDHGVRLDAIDVNEHVMSSRQSAIVAELVRAQGHEVELIDAAGLTATAALYAKTQRINTTLPRSGGTWDLALEIHHNAVDWEHGPQAGLVLHWRTSSAGRLAAQRVADALAHILPWACGARPDSWSGNARNYFLRTTRPPSLIIEPCYWRDGRGDMQSAVDWYQRGGEALEAQAIAQGLGVYLADLDSDRRMRGETHG